LGGTATAWIESPGAAEDRPRRLTLTGARHERLYFAQVREDPLLEIEALRPGPAETVVVVSSAGCTALSLLAAGAGEVVAVDLNATQNHLVELKAAATALGSAEALAFLGGAPAEGQARQRTYRALRRGLSPGARTYWDAHARAVRRGVLASGRTEGFVGLITRALRLLVHSPARVGRLLACRTLEEQRAFYHAEWNTRRWRALFDVLLSRTAFEGAYDPAFFANVDQPTFARHFLKLVERGLTELPVETNYFLHQMLTGRYPTRPDGLPPYLSPEGAARVAGARGQLTLVDGDVAAYLQTRPAGSVHAFALSNIAEWLTPPQIEALFGQIVRAAAPGARLVFRNFVGWTEVPPRWRDAVREDRARGVELMRQDRSLCQRRFAICEVTP